MRQALKVLQMVPEGGIVAIEGGIFPALCAGF